MKFILIKSTKYNFEVFTVELGPYICDWSHLSQALGRGGGGGSDGGDSTSSSINSGRTQFLTGRLLSAVCPRHSVYMCPECYIFTYT